MRRGIVLLLLASCVNITLAQLALPPNGDNQRSETSQYMGLVKVSVNYSSPDVDGREIWGKVVPFGMTNFNVGKSTGQNPSPWRAGANENTIVSFSHDVEVEGKLLRAGLYGLHMIPGKMEWTVIFSYNSNAWGSFFYTPEEDALRVTVQPAPCEKNEWLTYSFTDRLQNSCTLQMKWDQLMVPIKIRVPNGDDLYVRQIEKQAQGAMGFQGPQFAVWQNWVQAANFCASKKIHLEEAKSWLENYLGQGLNYFRLVQAKSNVLAAMGKEEEANALMKGALQLPDATMGRINVYAQNLVAQSRLREAQEAFEVSVKRYPKNSSALLGLAKIFSVNGDFKKARKFAEKAYDLESDPTLKDNIKQAIERLNKKEIISY